MNWLQFLRLIVSIYGKGLPDIEWIQSLGLLAVKIGQVHALRIDFLDREKCLHLAKLYRQNINIPMEEIKRLLISYVDNSFVDSFKNIDEKPLASASVGQVHKALLNDGKEVVVKVIKKDFRSNFIKDVRNVRNLFRFLTFVYPKLRKVGDPVGILNDIEEYTLSELDLRNEVRGQEILRSIYEQYRGRYDLSKLHFTKVYETLSNDSVMISDFIRGKTFDELMENNALEYSQLMDLFHIHGFYMFVAGTFHGDIHPGNIILDEGKIYFIDTGYIGHIGDKIRKGLFLFFESLSFYDYPSCANALNQMSERELTGKTYDEYFKKFLLLYQDFTDKTVSEISLTKKMMQTIKLGVHSGMIFEKDIFAIIRSLMYMDGMVLRCNPNAVLMKDMRKFIDEFKKAI